MGSLIFLFVRTSYLFIILVYFLGFVNELIDESLNNNDTRSLSVAFLLIRQVSFQGGHVSQPYVTWFQVSVICVDIMPEIYFRIPKLTTGIFCQCTLYLERHSGLMVSALVSRSSGLGLSPGRGNCVVFLAKKLYSHSASLHPGA